MARKKRTTEEKEVQDYRHDTATRKNNPPAGIAAQGKSKKHQSRNTHTTRICPPTSALTQVEMLINSPNSCK